jgi:hypothetical protein
VTSLSSCWPLLATALKVLTLVFSKFPGGLSSPKAACRFHCPCGLRCLSLRIARHAFRNCMTKNLTVFLTDCFSLMLPEGCTESGFLALNPALRLGASLPWNLFRSTPAFTGHSRSPFLDFFATGSQTFRRSPLRVGAASSFQMNCVHFQRL